MEVGTGLGFDLNHSALLRAMTSPFVARSLIETMAEDRQVSGFRPTVVGAASSRPGSRLAR